MPEGPEIKRAADKIAAAIAHQPIGEIFFAFEHLKRYEPKFTEAIVSAVQSKGKAILIGCSNQLNIYTHNQLYGKWIITKAYAYPDTKRQLRLAIHNWAKSALLYSASDIEVLNDEEIADHYFLSKLGPDVLATTTTLQQIEERFVDARFHRRQFTSLLLDQRFLCGLGNYLRSEVLFVARIHPTRRPVDCFSKEIAQLAKAVVEIPYQSYQTGGITNNIELANELKRQGYKRTAYRHWVFNREDQPCFICGTQIVKAVSGGRRYYYCPTCQSL